MVRHSLKLAKVNSSPCRWGARCGINGVKAQSGTGWCKSSLNKWPVRVHCVALVRANVLRKYLVILFTPKMPPRNSRSALHLQLFFPKADGRARSSASVWNADRSEVLLSCFGQPTLSGEARRAGICHAKSGERAGATEETLRAQNQAMWQ